MATCDQQRADMAEADLVLDNLDRFESGEHAAKFDELRDCSLHDFGSGLLELVLTCVDLYADEVTRLADRMSEFYEPRTSRAISPARWPTRSERTRPSNWCAGTSNCSLMTCGSTSASRPDFKVAETIRTHAAADASTRNAAWLWPDGGTVRIVHCGAPQADESSCRTSARPAGGTAPLGSARNCVRCDPLGDAVTEKGAGPLRASTSRS